MDELPTELNVITLNCWGLLYLSEHRAERLTAIGRYLAIAEPTPHIVALQECWTQDDYRSIRRETRFALPFGKFYHSGVFGSGLAILSKWPIEESTMFRYPLNGRPTAFFRGDWYVGKGVACARIRYGPGEKDVVEVFNTHTHPSYERPQQRDTYMVHRLSQAWEIAKLIRGATERGHLALALGDFNDVPLSLPYRLMTAHAPVRDAWRVLNPDSSLGSAEHDMERARRRPIPAAGFNIDENGVTTNSVYNTWSWSKSEQKALRKGNRPMIVPPNTPDPGGERVDYIFYSRGLSPSVTSELCEILSAHNHCPDDEIDAANLNPPGWVVKDVRVGLTLRHPTLGCSLSDHFSVEATFLLHTPNPQPPARRGGERGNIAREALRRAGSIRSHASTEAGAITIGALEQGTYLQSPTASEHQRRNSRDRAAFDTQLQGFHSDAVGAGLPYSTYDEILALIRAYEDRERSQRKWRTLHCLAWVLAVLGCYAAIWFVPRPVTFAFLVIASLGFLAGAVDGLLALLFFGPELAALAEFEWEIMNAKATASGAYGLVQGGDDGEKTWYGDMS
ncbi:Endonuclease/exonuclease/phosphatase [Biscogniauxia marginata]|nr:Endonuclease/exonuclease/phosphatase [Biscogniauxia marginata]